MSCRKPRNGVLRKGRANGSQPNPWCRHGPPSLRPQDFNNDKDPFSPTLPDWMRVRGKVSMLVNEKLYKGTLDLNKDNDWVFTVRNRTCQIVLEHGLYDLPYSWRTQMIEESLILGRHPISTDDASNSQLHATERHVSASSLHKPNPGTLRKALNRSKSS